MRDFLIVVTVIIPLCALVVFYYWWLLRRCGKFVHWLTEMHAWQWPRWKRLNDR